MTSYADTRVTTPPDIHALLTEYLLRDMELTSFVQERIFAGSYPEGTHMPAVRFSFPNSSVTAPPSMNIWTFSGQVDIHADTPTEAEEIMRAVVTALIKLEGSSHEQGSLISLFPWNVGTATDSSWSPPKFQKIVAVTLTARTK